MTPARGAARLELRLPAAALCVWVDGPAAVGERLRKLATADRGIVSAGPGIWLVVPAAGRPAVFDAAVELGGRIVTALGAELGSGKTRALVLATSAAVGSEGTRPAADPLFDELVSRPPKLAPDILQLTTYVGFGLERRYSTTAAGQLETKSGRVLPLLALNEPARTLAPWRNPIVLGRAPRSVPRPGAAAALAELLTRPAARLSGALGVGKTRLASEVLQSQGRQFLWRATATDRPRPPLEQLLAEDRRRPLWLVYDDVESASAEVTAEIDTLLARPELGRGVHALLVARSAAHLSKAAAQLPALTLAPLDGDEWVQLADQLFQGLSLPDPVARELADSAHGNPFALEEALAELVRMRQLRHVFGSFFFSGSEADARFSPSMRFRLHAEAEAARVGDALPLRLLALAGASVPPDELRAAALALGAAPIPTDWSKQFEAAGLLRPATGPWGDGVAFGSPAIGRALAEALPESALAAARTALGELLAARSASAEGLWRAWPLLAGSDAGARTALDAARARGGPPQAEQYAALRAELASVLGRSGEPALELDLLWALLPIARRLGRLHELEGQIERGLELAGSDPERFVAIAAVAADMAQKAGKLRDAEAVLRRALAVARGVDERRKELLVLELGRVLGQLGRKAEARDLFAKAEANATRGGRPGVAATCLFMLGNLAFHDLDFVAARSYHEQALELRRHLRFASTVSASLAALGAVGLAEGNLPEALARYEEARATLGKESAEAEESWALLGLGRALDRLGDAAGALPVLRRALHLREGRDDARGEAIARIALADALLRVGQLESAQHEARKAHFALALLPEGEARAEAERVLGEILVRHRRPADGANHLAEAERLYRAAGNDLVLPEVLGLRLEAALALGRVDAVRAAWEALVEERRRRPEVAARAICDFQLFHGAEWLRTKGQSAADPLPFLERAFAELMRQTAFLAPELRQRFLFQVPAHQAIIDAATRRGLGLPA